MLRNIWQVSGISGINLTLQRLRIHINLRGGKMKKIALAVPALLSLMMAGFGSVALAEEVPEASQATFAKEVLASDKPVVVDFFATWCGPCRKMGPIIESLSKDYAGKVSFVRVDVDKNNALALKYNISGIPAIKIFKGGQVVDSSVGLGPEQELSNRIAAAAGVSAVSVSAK
jgi:thioredoxin 1